MNKHSTLCQIYAGWLGKLIGVRLGAPVEMWTHERIEERYQGQHGYLCDYNDFAADDDLNGPVFFIRALEDCGCPAESMTARDVGRAWLQYASWGHGMFWWGGYGISSEHTAYENLRAGVAAPESGSCANAGKVLSEQIGGQIFIDAWGLCCPGDPARAALLAGKAAHVAHDGEAVYGGQFVAACIAAAFTATGVEDMLETGLRYIPEDSEYARCVRQVMAWHDEMPDDPWACFASIRRNYWRERYPGNCHIIPNLAIMILALCYGEGDFTKTLELCNRCGFDTDCNVGNLGTMMGVLCGLDGIDSAWRQPINDFFVCSGAVGSLNIRDAAEYTRELAQLACDMGSWTPDDEERRWLSCPDRWNFRLPGSCQDVRTERGETIARDAQWTEDGLLIDSRGGVCRAFVRTYIQPRDLHDNRYDPAFSPLIYPGQTIEAEVSAPENVRIYAEDCGGKRLYGAWGREGRLTLRLPEAENLCWRRIGVESQGCAFRLKAMGWKGKPDYTLQASALTEENWGFPHTEISQFTRVRGYWYLEDGLLCGVGSDACRALTGGIDWTDYAAETVLHPGTASAASLLVRVSGAMRCYRAQVESDGRVQLLREDVEETLLAEGHVVPADRYTLRMEACGGHLTVAVNGEAVLAADDPYPLTHGGVGLDVRCPGSATFESLAIRPLGGENA